MNSTKSKSHGALKSALSLVLLSSTSLLIAGTAQAVSVEVSSYSFEDLSTSLVATDSISANNGVGLGEVAPVASSDVPFTHSSNKASAEFNGYNAFELNNNIGGDFSICAWIKTSSLGGGQHWTSAPIVDSESGGAALDFGFGVNQDGKLVFGNGGLDSNANLGDSQIDGNTVVSDSTWHHVCVTRNNTQGEVNLFVDGVLDITGVTGIGLLVNNPKLKVGNGSDGNQPFVGFIDELRLFTTVLSADEVKAISTPPAVVEEEEETDSGTSDGTDSETSNETVTEEKATLADTGETNSSAGLMPFAASLIGLGLLTMFISKKLRRASK